MRFTLYTLIAMSFGIVACTSKPHSQRVVASEESVSYDITEGELYQHPNLSMPLPFDPIYRDSNRNGQIDPEEIRPDNIRKTVTGGNQLFSLKPIVSLGLQRGQLALTVDDGPNENVTPKILNLLDDYNIKATFFIVGSRIPSRQALVKEMVARGHTIGNHTYSHDIPQITPSTIVSEMRSSHTALTNALGREPEGRILFRAPGLGWSQAKALVSNKDGVTRKFIGPIHANLGTDAPRADWSCWSKGVSAETCAKYYYQDIMNAGRGIVLTHDIYYRPGRGNTYELLRILLSRLENEGGGIKNKSGSGVWEFVNVSDSKALDQFDVTMGSGSASGTSTSDSASPAKEGGLKGGVLVRNTFLASVNRLDDSSKIYLNGGVVMTNYILRFTPLDGDLSVDGYKFKMVRIEAVQSGYESLIGQTVYISAKAFQ